MLRIADVARRTGWTVHAHEVVTSTNDVASRLREEGAPERTVVVAERQTAGRGRAGRSFASPLGGLYASVLLRVPATDLPGPLVGAAALAVAEAVEVLAGIPTQIKWPNDVRCGGAKVAGLLLEAGGQADAAGRTGVVLGVGVNVAVVPDALTPAEAAATTALDLWAPAPVAREALLVELLTRLDAHLASLASPVGRARLEEAYGARLALRGARVRFRVGRAETTGILREATLDRGLCVEGADGVSRWHAAAHVTDLREAPASDGPGG